ncbi:GMC family oxidoreductase [Pseudonocardia abyssalis]|uniref:GMC family oxidoreductase N-terminal domain-containing protein n=1 Tax=Pseudonocardia abyssalis TaxID=2792008 RepID=A0ABS6UMC9_9PSEU|nr:GMC family oxidoreductase N-terminal domain-containing protein [Pseudonocardia abyssalis]MBW0114434.1 GMC family oxidoreductase N-terminal domain-containing protein [Pseudonocardia abyssalis]MBW0133091.1 GMC family oxidoreductase N-terminal domain-containing protein [Pseudonocardia abyssalis]
MSNNGAGTAVADGFGAVRANQDRRAENLQPAYDYVVCGSGSAGCVVASRLAANPSVSVLLIEAGGWDTAEQVLDPGQWFTNLGTDRDWGDVAIPGPGVNGRAIPEHMGRVVGGGTSINATIWARPFRADLDCWAEVTGDPAWGYEHGLEIFRQVEDWQGDADPRYRGKGGPVWCQPAHDPSPLVPALLDAAAGLGHPVLADQNGAREESAGGFALMNQIIRDGRRRNMAAAFLYPVLAQDNITVLTGAHVDRVVIEGGRATGVEVAVGAGRRVIGAGSEVVLSAGGINTAKILMLSGIGDAADLRGHGIEVVADSPEVGANFQDHILHGGCLWEPHEAQAPRNSAANAAGFWKSDGVLASPDINIVQIEIPYASEVVAAQYAPPPSSWALCAGLVAPKSRGRMTLRSADPRDRPVLDAAFLSHPDDVAALAKGIELCRELGNSPQMRPFAKREVAPGRELSPSELVEFVRNGATTYFHEAGTCRMGRDSAAVVDPELRVNGVQNLRVADASVMPRIPGVATMATCVLIGARMAEILGAGG